MDKKAEIRGNLVQRWLDTGIMDAPGRQMKKSSRIDGRSGLRWAIKNQRVGKKVVGKGTVCTGRARGKMSKNKRKNKIK